MTISYENTDEDALAWNLYRVFHMPQTAKQAKRQRYLLTLAAGLWAFCVFRLLNLSAPLFPALLSGLLAAALYLVYHPRSLRRGTKVQTRTLVKQGHFHRFLGPQRVELAPDGFHTHWSEGEARINWSALKRWEATATHVALVWSEAEFTLIPKRAFHGASHLRAFLERIEECREASAGGGLAPAAALPVRAASLPEEAAPQAASAAPAAPWWREEQNVEAETLNTLRRGQ